MQIYRKDRILARYKYLVEILEIGGQDIKSAIRLVGREFGLPEETIKTIISEAP